MVLYQRRRMTTSICDITAAEFCAFSYREVRFMQELQRRQVVPQGTKISTRGDDVPGY